MNLSDADASKAVFIHEYLDTLGLACPLPLLKMKLTLSKMGVGERIQVSTSDRASLQDFRVFCELSGNLLLSTEARQCEYIFVIEKRQSR